MSVPERLLDSTTFLITVSFQLIVPILPIYVHDVLGASEQEVGVIISLAAIASALTRIPSSFWTMRRNILKVMFKINDSYLNESIGCKDLYLKIIRY